MKITKSTLAEATTYGSLEEIPDRFVDNGILMLDRDDDVFMVASDWDAGPEQRRRCIGIYGSCVLRDALVIFPARKAPAGFTVTLTQED